MELVAEGLESRNGADSAGCTRLPLSVFMHTS
jgi:hypothetical protein